MFRGFRDHCQGSTSVLSCNQFSFSLGGLNLGTTDRYTSLGGLSLYPSIKEEPYSSIAVDEKSLYDMELMPVDEDLLPEMAELAKSYLR